MTDFRELLRTAGWPAAEVYTLMGLAQDWGTGMPPVVTDQLESAIYSAILDCAHGLANRHGAQVTTGLDGLLWIFVKEGAKAVRIPPHKPGPLAEADPQCGDNGMH